MGERVNKVQKMIKDNKNEQAKIKNKYNNKDTVKRVKELDRIIKAREAHIEKMQEELKDVSFRDINLIDEYKKDIQKSLEGYTDEYTGEKIAGKNECLEEKQKLETQLKEEENAKKKEIESEVMDSEDKLRTQLTQEGMQIDKDINRLDLSMKLKLTEMQDFKYEYEEVEYENEKGEKVIGKKPINGEQYRALNTDYEKMVDELKDLKQAKLICEKELDKFKQKDEQKMKKVNEAIKKEQQVDSNAQDKLLNDMIKGREKREEQRYKETIKQAMEDEKKKQEEEKKIEEQNIEEGLQWEEKRKTQQEGKPKTNSKNVQTDATIQAQINKVKEEFQKANTDYKNIHLVADGQIDEKQVQGAIKRALGTDIPEDLKIEIGRKGKITYKGITYELGKSIIKEGINLTQEETVELAKEMGMNDTKEAEKILGECIKEKLVDSTVLRMISNMNMPIEDKKKIARTYITDAFNVKTGKAFENNCKVEYNEKDLSKSGLFARIFRKEVNEEEKIEMISRARTANRNSMADIRGEYKPDRVSRFMNWIRGEETVKMPTMKDKQIVGEEFNKLLNKNEVDKINSNEYMKNAKLTEVQKQELKELYKSQTRNMKEEIHVDIEETLKEQRKKMGEEVERFTGEVIDKEGNVISGAEEEPQL